MAKSSAYPLCCSSLFLRSTGIVLCFSLSRACPCRTLPKTILKIIYIKLNLLKNQNVLPDLNRIQLLANLPAMWQTLLIPRVNSHCFNVSSYNLKYFSSGLLGIWVIGPRNLGLLTCLFLQTCEWLYQLV